MNATTTQTENSPYARLRPFPLTAITLTDTFWAPRRVRNRTVTLPTQFALLEETGRLNNFRRAAGRPDIPFSGYYFNDSDVYKWLEAAAWTLADTPDPALSVQVEQVITLITAAQQPDGYLNTYFMYEKAGARWANLRDMHELYCAGHLIQAAIAHRRASDDHHSSSERLLAVAIRLADHIAARFGPQGMDGAPGHEEIEMALVELYRETGNGRYLTLAQFFLDRRGHGLLGGRAYHQDHQPFRDLTHLAGHAVRAAYLNAGAADLLLETGETALWETLTHLWQQMTMRQMYVSGGIGARHEEEAFGEDYELPNARAYAESCAAIGSIFWQWRMLAYSGDARYADLLEWTLYNAALPGIGLDGHSYFYHNPLASDGQIQRQPWFTCACCPPNIARLLAMLPGYVYSRTKTSHAANDLWVHLYIASELRTDAVHLVQHSNYPWSDEVTIEMRMNGRFSLHMRLPSWVEMPRLTVNGVAVDSPLWPGQYTTVTRDWRVGDRLELHLPMPVRYLASHPHVANNLGKVAVQRGPLLYCLEQVDNPDVDIRDVALRPLPATVTTIPLPALAGALALRLPAWHHPLSSTWAEALYRPQSAMVDRAGQEAWVTAVPYCVWGNREVGAMRVWLPFQTM
ncbi:MAG: glycoside hydrolase family 127 protein [Chloroflexota bacterium]